MNDANGIVVALVALVGHIAAAVPQCALLIGEVTALIERRNVLIGVDQLKVGRNEEVRAGDLAGTVDRDRGGRLIGGAESSENQALDVQDDVGDIPRPC